MAGRRWAVIDYTCRIVIDRFPEGVLRVLVDEICGQKWNLGCVPEACGAKAGNSIIT